ncbi:hypothetical protein [Sutterella sp.]|uniref:hypothetical protein n=1 Tax=Sutterella sp. TaxID=1981025 RepID=UPI0026DF34A3|nr:hypothetical protein [Sutterella sp.]MDO5532272.1 hypothetical protein [Sutterella sp.]
MPSDHDLPQPHEAEPVEFPENDRILERLRAGKNIKHHSRWQPSRLDRHAYELMRLAAGVDGEKLRPAQLQNWLRERRISVALSTVTRWLEKHRPEIERLEALHRSHT